MKENTSNSFAGNRRLFNKILPIIVAVCAALLIFSCKTRKQLISARPVADSTVKVKTIDLKAERLNAIRAAQTNFNTFSGRASTQLNLNGNKNNVTLNLRLQNGKKIWASVTAIAGIEVARALVTPDSIFLINRLQSVYFKKPFSYINKLAGKQVNFKTLESLFIGNAVPELLNNSASLQTIGDTVTVSGVTDSLVYKLILGPGMRAVQTNISNQSESQSLQVTNNAVVQAVNHVMPTQIDIKTLVNGKKIQVNLHYTKFDFDQPLEFPFSIPASYDEIP